MTSIKGSARREAIVVAAAELVVAHGPAAVSHRTVATAAGVPLAATTYYFRDLDDLLVTAVGHATTRELTAAAALVDRIPRGRRSARDTAVVLTDVLLGADRHTDAELQAGCERWLAGGRRPALRPVLRAARARLLELVVVVLARGQHDGIPADRVVALAEGTALAALVEGAGPARPAVEAALADLLSRRRRW